MKKLSKNIENTLNESIEAYAAKRDCWCNCDACICDCYQGGSVDISVEQSNSGVAEQNANTLTTSARWDII